MKTRQRWMDWLFLISKQAHGRTKSRWCWGRKMLIPAGLPCLSLNTGLHLQTSSYVAGIGAKIAQRDERFLLCTHLRDPPRNRSSTRARKSLEKYQRPVRTAPEQTHPNSPANLFIWAPVSWLHLSRQRCGSNQLWRVCLLLYNPALWMKPISTCLIASFESLLHFCFHFWSTTNMSLLSKCDIPLLNPSVDRNVACLQDWLHFWFFSHIQFIWDNANPGATCSFSILWQFF